jgi:hypothetical protein
MSCRPGLLLNATCSPSVLMIYVDRLCGSGGRCGYRLDSVDSDSRCQDGIRDLKSMMSRVFQVHCSLALTLLTSLTQVLHTSCLSYQVPLQIYIGLYSCTYTVSAEVERAASLLRKITETHPHIRHVETAEDTIVYTGTTHEEFVSNFT